MADMTPELLLELLGTAVDYHRRDPEPHAYYTSEEGFGIAYADQLPIGSEIVATRKEMESMIGGGLDYLNGLSARTRGRVIDLTLDVVNVSLEDL